MARILLVDDDDALRRMLAQGLSDAGHDIEQASNGNDAIACLHAQAFDLVLSDLKMSGSDGLAVLRSAQTVQPKAAAILMTGFGSVVAAVESMQIGATDFLEKPFGIGDLTAAVERALGQRRLQDKPAPARREPPRNFDKIIGSSPALRSVLGIVTKVAGSMATVLIGGETGTGKELIASAIHDHSPRVSKNFVRVNCAALQDTLLESELFGHEKGAFTGADKVRIGRFEQANGGTLFLDEIGDMSAATQAKILRVLQEHEFERLGSSRTLRTDVRLIAATNRDLATMVKNGEFREDLYYRLNVVSIEMPALRDRRDDVLALAAAFLHRFSGKMNKKVTGISPEAQKPLVRYNWPGNVRELENVIERAVLLAEGPVIELADLRLGDAPMVGASREHAPAVVIMPPAGVPLEEIERLALLEALRMSGGVQKDAAQLLHISDRVFSYKKKHFGIELKHDRC